jgi:transcriptional regulator with XRE-family HTH domain
MDETISKRLTRLRKRAKLSQAALAKRAGLAQGTIGNIESGIREYGKSVVVIAYALGVSPQYLQLETDIETAAPTVSVPGYSAEAMALAWLLDQVTHRMDKVRANAAATAAILAVLQGPGE